MKEQGRVIFTVRMFGEFSITCNGKEIQLGRKSTAKYIQMLQLVWIRGDKGITKEQLMNYLYDRKDVSNSNNSVNNLIYQLRGHMVKLGLPKGEYISRVNGVYKNDAKFPISLDVLDFTEQVYLAREAEDEATKLKHYRKAFDFYKGEILPGIATELWVMEEGRYLKHMFDESGQWLLKYYAEQADYNSMGYVCDRAAILYPFDGWQMGQIDALLAKGDYKKANLIYNDMVSLYMEELGQPPSKEMQDCYRRINDMIGRLPSELEDIKNEIWRYPGAYAEEKGTYYCSYSGFVDICHMLSRNMERTGMSSYIMLCTLVNYKKKMISNQDKIQNRIDALKEVIQSCLRKGDVFTQYSSYQFLIMLVGAKEEECENIFRRISLRLKEKAGCRAEIEYVAVSLADLQPQIEWK